MNNFSKDKINEVLKAIDAVYNRIDACRDNEDDGYCFRVAEYQQISNDSAMDMIMSEGGDAYEFIEEELIDEAVDLITALYWAREHGEILSYPMVSRTEPHPDSKEYFSEFGKAIKEKLAKVQLERKQAEMNRITKEFGEWADNTISKMEQDFPFLKEQNNG